MRVFQLPALLLSLFLLLPAVLWGLPLPKPFPKSQPHEKNHMIEKLEDSWHNAILKHDAAAMDALMGRDYVAITADGTFMSREQTLEGLRDGTLNYLSFEISDRKIRFYGSTAVVTSQANVRRQLPTGESYGDYLYTRVYARDPAGKWKIVHFEVTRVADSQDKK